MRFLVVAGNSYLYCFIGDPAVEKSCIAEKFKGCMDFMEFIDGVAHLHP